MNYYKIILVLSFMPLFVMAQTSLESAFIKSLNIYRKERNLSQLIYDSASSKITCYHARYLNNCNDLNIQIRDHDETVDIKNFKEYNFDQRAKKVLPVVWIGEIQLQYYIKNNYDSISAKNILQIFHNSPPHREIMNIQIPDNIGILPIVSTCIEERKDEFDQIVLSTVVNFGYKEIKKN